MDPNIQSLLLGTDGQVSLAASSSFPESTAGPVSVAATPYPDGNDPLVSAEQMPFGMPGIQVLTSLPPSIPSGATLPAVPTSQVGGSAVALSNIPNTTSLRVSSPIVRATSISRPASSPRLPTSASPLALSTTPPPSAYSTSFSLFPSSSNVQGPTASSQPNTPSGSKVPLIIAIVFTSVVVLATLGASLSWLIRIRRRKNMDEILDWNGSSVFCPGTTRGLENGWKNNRVDSDEKPCAQNGAPATSFNVGDRPMSGVLGASTFSQVPFANVGLGLGLGTRSGDDVIEDRHLSDPFVDQHTHTDETPFRHGDHQIIEHWGINDLTTPPFDPTHAPYLHNLLHRVPHVTSDALCSPYSSRLQPFPDGEWEDIPIATPKAHPPSSEGWGSTFRNNISSIISNTIPPRATPHPSSDQRFTSLVPRKSSGTRAGLESFPRRSKNASTTPNHSVWAGPSLPLSREKGNSATRVAFSEGPLADSTPSTLDASNHGIPSARISNKPSALTAFPKGEGEVPHTYTG